MLELFTILFWGAMGSACSFLIKKSKPKTLIALIVGIGLLVVYLVYLWINLGRPPMGTMGETRLWYVLFLLIGGYLTYKIWDYKFIVLYVVVLSLVFVTLCWIKQDAYHKTLMPALQSIWFAPHVGIYMFAYGIAGAVFCLAIYGLCTRAQLDKILISMDLLTTITIACLHVGLLFGAIWGKMAWGHFWNWDPKETAALLTCLIYWIYIHQRKIYPKHIGCSLVLSILGFIILQLCWWGVNYLPTASQSLHIYGR